MVPLGIILLIPKAGSETRCRSAIYRKRLPRCAGEGPNGPCRKANPSWRTNRPSGWGSPPRDHKALPAERNDGMDEQQEDELEYTQIIPDDFPGRVVYVRDETRDMLRHLDKDKLIAVGATPGVAEQVLAGMTAIADPESLDDPSVLHKILETVNFLGPEPADRRLRYLHDELEALGELLTETSPAPNAARPLKYPPGYVPAASDTVLSIAEEEELAQHEATLRTHFQAFIIVGNALRRIKDGELYRAGGRTFEEYCKQKWGMTPRHAYRQISAAEVAANLTHGSHVPPANERQARALAPLSPEDQRNAWEMVEFEAGDAPITARVVQKAVRKLMKGKSGREAKDEQGVPQATNDNDESTENIAEGPWLQFLVCSDPEVRPAAQLLVTGDPGVIARWFHLMATFLAHHGVDPTGVEVRRVAGNARALDGVIRRVSECAESADVIEANEWTGPPRVVGS